MNEIRKITGYWGTYLPSDRLFPGMVGRVENGLFTNEDSLSSFAGFDPAVHGPQKPQPSRTPVSVWQSKEVLMTSTQASANAPGNDASGAIRVGFSKANTAVMICKGIRSQGLINLAQVRSLMQDLLQDGKWDKDLCVVTEVLLVKAAWICFATNRDQEAEIKASASVGLTGTPIDALTNAAVKGDLSTSWSDKKSAGYSTEVTDGGTPLFHALRFKRSIFGLGPQKLQFLRGAATGFEEPEFGESDVQGGVNP
jgi:hypothetical protein